MASGDLLAVFWPTDNEPPSSNYATVDFRNGHPVLDFDDTVNEAAVFRGVMPSSYSGGGVTVRLTYAMTGATSGDVDWDAAFERLAPGSSLDSDSFAAAQSVDDTPVPGTAGEAVEANIAFADGAEMDSVAAGDLFRLRITRDAASDTATGDAELVAVCIFET